MINGYIARMEGRVRPVVVWWEESGTYKETGKRKMNEAELNML